jgi:hypothetical protein
MKIRSLLVAAALAVPVAAHAQTSGISYDYAQISYEIWTDPDVHHWTLKGSYQVADNVYITAEDTSGHRSAGAGYFFPVQRDLHLYGQLSLGDSGDGFRPILEGGARFAVNSQLEVRGAVRYISDAYGNDDEIMLIGEGAYQLNQKIALVAGLGIPTEADGVVLQFGGRLNF